LTKAFTDSGFDLRYLSEAILSTKAYQLSSASTSNSSDPRLFSQMPVRALTGEQLYTSLRTASGMPAERPDVDPLAQARDRKTFINRFRVEHPAVAQRSIVQALTLMNGKLTADLVAPDKSPTLGAIVDSPFFDARGKIDALFLATLNRKPTDEEAAPLVRHVAEAGKEGTRRALADVYWVLLNSSEFNTNH
jgi:hypothetical protein